MSSPAISSQKEIDQAQAFGDKFAALDQLRSSAEAVQRQIDGMLASAVVQEKRLITTGPLSGIGGTRGQYYHEPNKNVFFAASFTFLSPADLGKASQASRQWYVMASDSKIQQIVSINSVKQTSTLSQSFTFDSKAMMLQQSAARSFQAMTAKFDNFELKMNIFTKAPTLDSLLISSSSKALNAIFGR